MARRLLEDVTVDEVAEDVIWALESIPITELATRSGRIQGRGYVDEHDAAWELVEEEFAPFLDHIRRRVHLELTEAAATVATGVVAGLYRIGQPDDLTVLVVAGEDARLHLAEEVFALVADVDLVLPADAAQHWPDWSDG